MGAKLVAFPLLLMVFVTVLGAFGMGAADASTTWYDGDSHSLAVGYNYNATITTVGGRVVGVLNSTSQAYIVTSGDANWTVGLTKYQIGQTPSFENRSFSPFISDAYSDFSTMVYYYNGTGAPSSVTMTSMIPSSCYGTGFVCVVNYPTEATKGFNWLGIFSIGGSTQFLGILFALIMLAIVLGVTAFTVGIKDTSIQFVLAVLVFGALWAFVSIPSTTLLWLLPFGVGYLIYFVSSLVYSIGVMGFAVHGGGD